MDSGLFQNGIINRTGSIPGAWQGLIADRPAAGYATGDWYLATDEKKLYQWTGSAWVVVLDGSGTGTTPTLQAVTTAGNTTTNNIEVRNSTAAFKVILQALASGAILSVQKPGGPKFELVSTLADNSAYAVITISGFAQRLIFGNLGVLTVATDYNFRNLGGTQDVAFLGDLSAFDLQEVTDNGNITTNDIIVSGGGSKETTLFADASFATANVATAATNMLQMVAEVASATCYLLYTSSTFSATLQYNSNAALTANQVYNLRNTGGTEEIAFLSDIPAASLPAVVASGNLATQTATITFMNYNIVGATGTFIINVYISALSVVGSSIAITVTFTDENSTGRVLTMVTNSLATSITAASGPGFYSFIPLTIRAKFASPIVVDAFVIGGGASFDVGGTIMQVN